MTDLKGDIRWKQRFQNFQKSYDVMQRLMAIDHLSEFERMALIQSFEISFELAWKVMKDYLESEGFLPKSPRETIKTAYQADLINKAQIWMDALVDRNLTVHTYDETFAIDMAGKIQKIYYPAISDFYTLMFSKTNM